MIRKFAGLLTLLVCLPGWSATCTCQIVTGQIQVAQQTFRGGDALAGCPGEFTVESSASVLCLFNGESGQLECDNFDRGTISTAWSCQTEQAGETEPLKKDFLTTLVALWSPDTDHEYGGLNLKETKYLDGFPYGDILLPGTHLILNAQTLQPINIESFTLKEVATATSVKAEIKEGRIYIPSAQLKPELDYEWTLLSDGESYGGEFTMAYEEDQREFEAELSEILTQQPMTGSARDIAAAALARSYGYTFDYQQYLFDAKQKLQFPHTR